MAPSNEHDQAVFVKAVASVPPTGGDDFSQLVEGGFVGDAPGFLEERLAFDE